MLPFFLLETARFPSQWSDSGQQIGRERERERERERGRERERERERGAEFEMGIENRFQHRMKE